MSEDKAKLRGKRQSGTTMNATPANTGAGTPVDPVPRAVAKPTLSQKAHALLAATKDRPPAHMCQQALKISVFFDGTGNNLKADLHTLEHSNVARLFRAHLEDDPSAGIYRRYVPGIGTLFPEIGDSGRGEIVDTHNAMGVMGQARLDWAMDEVQKIVRAAELRASNPTNQIVMITLAVFGFSRGATLARAFVRDLLQMKCAGAGQSLRWRQGNHPFEISFVGLWDTVAAVGIPIGANNVKAIRRERLSMGNVLRAHPLIGGPPRLLRAVDLAFGAPGADPTEGPANGHAAWAGDLRIPDAVARCVHMMAAHEVRNSFPADSVASGGVKPGNCKEFVYPGVHSNVGGGYRPGEGGRGKADPMDSAAVADADKMLSLIPLKAMYDEALIAGVPLRRIASQQWTKDNVNDFDTDPDMQAAFDHYMDTVGRGTRTLGAAFLAHTRLYMAWRFHHIREKQAVRPNLEEAHPDKKTREERAIETNEQVWAQDQKKLDAELTQLRSQLQVLEQRRLNEQLALSRSDIDPTTLEPTPEGRRKSDAVNAQYDPKIKRLQTQIAELEARRQTLPSQGELVAGLSEYDALLLADASSILSEIEAKPSLRARLRPHYKNLVETYENEYVYRRGLDKNKEADKKIIDFFDHYVHDSLANFQLDSTLPSDPRVIYAGGDFKTPFAQLDRSDLLQSMPA
jgi:hypothetical protein